MRVGVEIGARRRIGLGVLDLLIDGVGVDHDAHRAGEVLLAQLGGPAQIDQAVGLGVKPPHLFAGQPVPFVVDRIPIGPTPAETMAFHRPAQIGDVVGAAHHDAGDAGIVRVGPAIFDIPDVIAEPLQPE